MEKSNKERLASIETSIIHIDNNVDKIAKNNINQWKQINQNTTNISIGKAISGIIAFIISVGTTMLIAFGIKQS